MFHAYCDAGLWNEADSAYRALDNPKHRFLAPALERDLLLRFFPAATGASRRSGRASAAIAAWPSAWSCSASSRTPWTATAAADAPLRGDALLALGRLEPLLDQPQAAAPWQTLWQAYRCHALCLAGRVDEAVALARSLVPVDVYEWLHVFECLLRAGRLDLLDLRSVLARPAGGEHRWAELARRRMQADFLRLTEPSSELGAEYEAILDAYDRAGLPLERALTSVSYARWLLDRDDLDRAEGLLKGALSLADAYGMKIVASDAWRQWAKVHHQRGNRRAEAEAEERAKGIGEQTGSRVPVRP